MDAVRAGAIVDAKSIVGLVLAEGRTEGEPRDPPGDHRS
jgi:hypothetical protein